MKEELDKLRKKKAKILAKLRRELKQKVEKYEDDFVAKAFAYEVGDIIYDEFGAGEICKIMGKWHPPVKDFPVQIFTVHVMTSEFERKGNKRTIQGHHIKISKTIRKNNKPAPVIMRRTKKAK